MGKFESYPSISALADDDITLINHNTVTHKISFATLATLIKNRIGLPTLGTAAAKNSTNAVTSGSADLVESGAVYDFVGKTLTAQTLAVGATTLTFTDSSIGNNSRIRVISNPFTSGLLNAVQNGNTVTLTFDAQEVALSVTLEVRN